MSKEESCHLSHDRADNNGDEGFIFQQEINGSNVG
jgi:hypothetical protein